MEYRRLGRTGLYVSTIGLGTCQLRLRPRDEALSTIRAAVAGGVNLIHTSPDYEGAQELVAEVLAECTAIRPYVLFQGYGPMPHFRHLYAQARAIWGEERLPLYGIACIEDREAIGEDVYGPDGMIAFLQEEKRAGRLGAIFCTTHSGPERMREYVSSGYYDAIMVAYNPLGFHLLTYAGGDGRQFEDMSRIRTEILPLAKERDVGVLVMKPLAGGLLARGRAFPPLADVRPALPLPRTADTFAEILSHPAVSSVLPGMASQEEVLQNLESPTGERLSLQPFIDSLCSRCGHCDSLCSRGLQVSWIFRDGYIQMYPSETFESPGELRIGKLHPDCRTACLDCQDQSCQCPQGITIPQALPALHAAWREAMQQFLPIAVPVVEGVRVLDARVPTPQRQQLHPLVVRVQNTSSAAWKTGIFSIRANGVDTGAGCSIRHPVHPGESTHLVVELPDLATGSECSLWLDVPDVLECVPVVSWQTP